jgi:integrase
MLDLKSESSSLENDTITGGTKTRAGKDRIVPIYSKIRSIVERRMSMEGEYLFSNSGKSCSKSTYRIFRNEIMKAASIQHTPHDCRHTFRSRLDSAGANKKCIDLMMGHKSKDVGERIYTHKTLDELRAAIELVTS